MTLTNSEAIRLGNEALATSWVGRTPLAAQGWTFKLNTNKTRLGVCKYGKRQRNRFTGETRIIDPRQGIEISVYCVAMGLDTFNNTLLHEIAHALVGPDVKAHGHEWRAMARAIGCTGDRCGKMGAPAKYIGTCPTCQGTVKRNRNTRNMARLIHRPCFNRGKYAPLQWSHLPKVAAPAPFNPFIFIHVGG